MLLSGTVETALTKVGQHDLPECDSVARGRSDCLDRRGRSLAVARAQVAVPVSGTLKCSLPLRR